VSSRFRLLLQTAGLPFFSEPSFINLEPNYIVVEPYLIDLEPYFIELEPSLNSSLSMCGRRCGYELVWGGG